MIIYGFIFFIFFLEKYREADAFSFKIIRSK